jgi:ParB-like chromosome segregation protein Spo0J
MNSHTLKSWEFFYSRLVMYISRGMAIKLTSLLPNARNPRNISPARLQLLQKSIQDFEKMMALRPIVIDEKNTVLGGNMRLRALQELGYTEIPNDWVKRTKDLTEDEKRRFILADNVGFGNWEWEILAQDWTEQELQDFGVVENIPQAIF